MGFLKLFTGMSPEDILKKADALFTQQEYGLAKIEYEKALAKHEKKPADDSDFAARITEKLVRCKESLAAAHVANAKELLESNCGEDADELLHLAAELTSDPELFESIRLLRRQIAEEPTETESENYLDTEDQEPWEEDEYFTALVNSLPEERQRAYHTYGDEFQTGYVALNQGDFQTAVRLLRMALEKSPSRETYILLELATALLNQGAIDQAESLLLEFSNHFPQSIRACQLRCEILWERKQFAEAEKLLQACPPEIQNTQPIRLLVGETWFLAGDVEKANRFYQEILDQGDWDEMIAQSLAMTHEALGRYEAAAELYGRIMDTCQSCGRRIDPLIKQRYAETRFQSGDHSTRLLDVYFNLTQTDPENNAQYFDRISRIYEQQGNTKEAQRYREMRG